MENFLIKIIQNSQSFKDQLAIKTYNQEITYKNLVDKSLKIANLLNKYGFRKRTIGVIANKSMSSYIGIIATLLSGCNFTPIIIEENSNKLLEIIKNSKISVFIGEEAELFKLLDWSDKYMNNLFLDLLITPQGYVINKNEKWFDENDLNTYSTDINFSYLQNLSLTAYILYTSGSTGKPKGVEITRFNLNSYINSITEIWPMPKGFRLSQSYDLRFDPSIHDIFYTLFNVGTLVVIPEKELMMPFDFIIREKLDIWTTVPSIGLFMLRMKMFKNNIFPNLKKIYSIGEPFPIILAEALQIAAPNATVENHYGPTEATIAISRYVYKKNIDLEFNNGVLPIGKSFTKTKIELIDDKNNKINEKFVKGEIIFNGEQISKGYLNNPQKTNEVFVNYPWDSSKVIWYKSGDLGIYNENMDIECLGRIDNQFKLGGKRIEAGEIEAQLSRYEETKFCVIVPIKDKNNITKFCVGFSPRIISKESLKNIKLAFSKDMDKIFFPKTIFHIEKIPKTIAGKINRNLLIEMAKNLL